MSFNCHQLNFVKAVLMKLSRRLPGNNRAHNLYLAIHRVSESEHRPKDMVIWISVVGMVLGRTVWSCVTRVTRPTKWIERHKCFITVWSWMSGWLAECLSKSASKDVGEHFARRTIPNNNWIIIQFKVYRIGKYSRQLLCPISRMFFRKSRGRSCVKEEGQRMVCIACDLGGKLLNFRLIAENQIQSWALREF